MDDQTENNSYNCDHEAVAQRTPEIRHLHSLREVGKTPVLGQGEDAGNIVGHLRGLLERDYNSHIQRENDGAETQDQQNHYRRICFIHTFTLHYNCSSFLLDADICAAEIATITIKKITALALWNPNWPPETPLL